MTGLNRIKHVMGCSRLRLLIVDIADRCLLRKKISLRKILLIEVSDSTDCRKKKLATNLSYLNRMKFLSLGQQLKKT